MGAVHTDCSLAAAQIAELLRTMLYRKRNTLPLTHPAQCQELNGERCESVQHPAKMMTFLESSKIDVARGSCFPAQFDRTALDECPYKEGGLLQSMLFRAYNCTKQHTYTPKLSDCRKRRQPVLVMLGGFR